MSCKCCFLWEPFTDGMQTEHVSFRSPHWQHLDSPAKVWMLIGRQQSYCHMTRAFTWLGAVERRVKGKSYYQQINWQASVICNGHSYDGLRAWQHLNAVLSGSEALNPDPVPDSFGIVGRLVLAVEWVAEAHLGGTWPNEANPSSAQSQLLAGERKMIKVFRPRG